MEMEVASEAAVGFLIESLVQLIKDNHELISGTGSKVAKLSDNLQLLKSFVTTYTQEHSDDVVLITLAKDIRRLLHEAEDAIEEYIYYVSLQMGKGKIDQVIHFHEHASNVRAASEKIKDISNRVNEMYFKNSVVGEEALRLEQSVKGSQMDKRSKPSLPLADNVTGFQDAVSQVIELLTGEEWDQQTLKQKTESEKLKVMSIVGMLGLGKTTLARKILSDPVVKYEFITRIFVLVSQDYEKREVLQDILLEGNFIKDIEELNGMSIEYLVKLIHDKLKNKYLVVLDDVWTNEAWDDLKSVFPDNKNGSRVLITTRHNSVAEYSNLMLKQYRLRFLYPEESRELLRTKVFDKKICPKHLEEIEAKIAEKCEGIPLLVVVTAGLLRNYREDKEWWEKVLRGVQSIISKDHQQQSDILIKTSYDHLPYNLKPCFLYLGVFPEDVEIPVWKLLRLWIAEGFIQQAPETSLEEIAEDYLMELVNRNLVMVGERRSNDQIKTCCVHDTLRYFCKKMAFEENLFREIKSSDEASGSSRSPSLKNCRRLCVNTYVSDYISGRPEHPFVRSFLSFDKDEITLQKDHCSLIVKPFKLIRVLDIQSIKLVGFFPAELPNLVLLKYIAINCDLKILPKNMSSLFNLQTIIIDTTSSTLDIQVDLWKMAQLRHLHTNASTTLPRCQEESIMVNLQTLSSISPESCSPAVFAKARKLKKLGICGKLGTFVQPNGESGLFDNLFQLELLENLKLHNDDVTCKLRALPLKHKFPAKLKRLSLQSTSLDWSHMSILGKLKCLEVLKLNDNAFKGKHWETEDGGFRCLKVLFIGATDLKVWKAASSNFPVLQSLALKHCSNLEAIPSDLANIKSLQMIDLEHTSISVVASARNMQMLQLRNLRQKKDIETSELKVKVYPPQ